MEIPDVPPDQFEKASAILRGGGLVAVPTETVYGLAANACDANAVAKIYAAKGRPSFNPLIAHVSGLAMAKKYARFDEVAIKLAKAFWPGPLTIVLPVLVDSGLANAVTAGLPTIALRHPIGVMAALAENLDKPIAAPSSNTSGKVSPTSADHVREDLGNKVDLILDGGSCAVGVESTIVKVENGKVSLLRMGGLPIETIEASVGTVEASLNKKSIEAPGMMLAHYAPSVPIRMNVTSLKDGEALLAFGPPIAKPAHTQNLSTSSDLDEAARNLFAMIKHLDRFNPTGIAVQPIPSDGIGAAINDRLTRAAQGTIGKRAKGSSLNEE